MSRSLAPLATEQEGRGKLLGSGTTLAPGYAFALAHVTGIVVNGSGVITVSAQDESK